MIYMRNKWKMAVIFFACALLALAGGGMAAAKRLPSASGARDITAKLSQNTLRVGKTTQVLFSKQMTVADGFTYSSSDTSVAYVNQDGRIIGKKPGRVQIKVKHGGMQAKTLDLTVKAASNKPTLPVALDEAALQSVRMKKNAQNGYTYSAVVKNRAKKGRIKKIIYYYQVEVLVPDTSVQKPSTGSDGQQQAAEGNGSAQTAQKDILPLKKQTKTVTLRASSINAGKKSKRVSCEGDCSGKLQSMKLVKICLYTGEALYEYNAKKGTGTLKWSGKDKKAPTFSGWVGKTSCYNKEPIRICYSDRKKTYKFKDHVSATDTRDGKVSFKADTSKINWNKEGIYKVYYTAKDKAGNVGKAYAKVQVYIPDTAENVADEVLASVIKKSWTEEKKLRAIYRYVKGHCSYVDSGTHKNWRNAGLRGIRYQSGDCFTYYAVARLLISRAGIYNLTVTRYPVASAHHWWNLVYVRGGWYHLDTTPRQRDGKFCLVTDAQLRSYSTGLTFSFNKKKYPKRAAKKISPNP